MKKNKKLNKEKQMPIKIMIIIDESPVLLFYIFYLIEKLV
jgi:hypothetical protein